MRLASRFCPLLFLSFLSFASVAAAQHRDSDFGVWGYVMLKKQFVGGFSGSLNCEIRSDNNAGNIALWWINPELKYKFNDYFTAEIGYRYSNVDRSDYYEQAHRWYTGGTAGMDWGPFRLTWRELIEQIYYTDRPEGSYGRIVSYLRTRLGIKLNAENMPLDPYFDVENFFHISDYRAGEVGIMRYTAGLRIPFGGGMHTLNIYYRYQQYFTSSPDDHILGLGYVLSL